MKGRDRAIHPASWSHNSIYYGLDVATFADGNGDGIGDLAGLRQRLDYLRRLGVTCLWLIPFYESPGRDNGYDVRDHCAIDRRLGTLTDFDRLLAAAHARGIRILIDLVANHTSDRHPWFEAARRGDAKYRDYYHWTRKPPPRAKQPRPVFPTQEDSVWSKDPDSGDYYFHRHYHHQPDLNLANPEVVEEIGRILAFWARRGVDGFRIDSLTHLFEKKSAHPRPDARATLHRWRTILDRIDPDIILLGEADVDPEHYVPHFGNPGHEVDLLLNFYLSSSLFLAFTVEDAWPLMRALERQGTRPSHGHWANFLRNLDELDLGQLTDSERRKILDTFAPKPSMQAYGRGARRRVAPMLADPDRIRLAWSLVFSMPGAPLFVYGDELAMGEDLRRRERHAMRLPMPWGPAPRSDGFCWKGRDPRPLTMPDSLRRVNVADQLADRSSFLHWFRGLARARTACNEMGSAHYRPLRLADPRVFGIEYRGKRALRAYHNLGPGPSRVRLPAREWELVWQSNGLATFESPTSLRLDRFGYAWLRRRA